jgi:DNA replication and repair protein RecF
LRILKAKINGYRNLAEAAFEFSPRVNLVLGRNGEGKTNFLEALNYYSLGRSHRGSKNEELVGFGQDSLHVSLEVEEDSGNRLSCDFGLDKGGGRRLRLDGEAVRRRTDLVGRLATVFFNPDSIQLVRGGPQQRRGFVDQGMSEVDPLYLSALTALQRVLKQKNSLLRDYKSGRRDARSVDSELQAWNREMATHATVICLGRWEYSRLLTPPAGQCHAALTDEGENLEILYRPQLESVAKFTSYSGGTEDENTLQKDHLEREVFHEIDYIRELEMQRGRLLKGPQLDDFLVRKSDQESVQRIGPESAPEAGPGEGLDLRIYGSQGETRTAAISLILARSDVLFARRQIRPVLFFDDIFSELDRERTRRLQELASRLHQVFIATARRDDVTGWRPADMKVWQVSSGVLTEED